MSNSQPIARKARARSPLPSSKSELSYLMALVYEIHVVKWGNPVTVCPVGIAPGASFSRNQHPRNGLRGVDPQS